MNACVCIICVRIEAKRQYNFCPKDTQINLITNIDASFWLCWGFARFVHVHSLFPFLDSLSLYIDLCRKIHGPPIFTLIISVDVVMGALLRVDVIAIVAAAASLSKWFRRMECQPKSWKHILHLHKILLEMSTVINEKYCPCTSSSILRHTHCRTLCSVHHAVLCRSVPCRGLQFDKNQICCALCTRAGFANGKIVSSKIELDILTPIKLLISNVSLGVFFLVILHSYIFFLSFQLERRLKCTCISLLLQMCWYFIN